MRWSLFGCLGVTVFCFFKEVLLKSVATCYMVVGKWMECQVFVFFGFSYVIECCWGYQISGQWILPVNVED